MSGVKTGGMTFGAVLLAVALLAGCAPRTYSFQPAQVRGATKILNRLGSEAKPHVEGVCRDPEAETRRFCAALRALYKGTLSLADGIDEAMNAADAQNTPAVDLDKVLSVGVKLLDLVTEAPGGRQAAQGGGR